MEPFVTSSAFRRQLDGLAAQYESLELENQRLRRLLLNKYEAERNKQDPSEVDCINGHSSTIHVAPTSSKIARISPDSPDPPPDPPPDLAPGARDRPLSAKPGPHHMRAENVRAPSRSSERSHGSGNSSTKAAEEPLDIVEKTEKGDLKRKLSKVSSNMSSETAVTRSSGPTDYYKTEGFWQAVARSPYFENGTFVAIAVNAIWIAVDTDYNTAELLIDADAIFIVVENLFCLYFSAELFIRFNAFRKKIHCFCDAWFVFDSILVTLMVLETWVMSIVLLAAGGGGGGNPLGNASIMRLVRLLRLTRVTRMARLLRAIPELMILIKAIGAAAQSVLITLVLLIFVIYVFAVAMTQLLKGSEVGDTLFTNVGHSMHSLWLYGTLLDEISGLMDMLATENKWLCVVLMNIFILVSALTCMNMLIGVLCEVVTKVSAAEHEQMALDLAMDKIQQVLALDLDGDGHISKSELLQLLGNDLAVKSLRELNVDVIGLLEFADVIFAAEDEPGQERKLTIEQFMEVIVSLRGDKDITMKDFVDLRKYIHQSISGHYKIESGHGGATP